MLDIPNEVAKLATLQNGINLSSMIGEPILAPTLGQLGVVEQLGEAAQGIYGELSSPAIGTGQTGK